MLRNLSTTPCQELNRDFWPHSFLLEQNDSLVSGFRAFVRCRKSEMQSPRDIPPSQHPPVFSPPALNTLILSLDTKAKVKKKVQPPSVYRLFPGCPHLSTAEMCMLRECSLLLYCDRQSEGQLLGRGLCLSVFPFPHFFLHSYLCPQFLFFTVSVDSSSELPAGGFMTCCLTRQSSFSVSLSIHLSVG